MKIIVYRDYGENDLYTLTLKHYELTDSDDFELDKDWEDFCDSFEYEYPFEIIECTERELKILKRFLYLAYDFPNTDSIKEDEIVVKVHEEILPYKEAIQVRRKEIEDLQQKIEELTREMNLYDWIYYNKYGCHIPEEHND